MEMNICSLSTVFPNPIEPDHGPFVRSRLRYMADLATLKVVAPIALLDYAVLGSKRRGRVPDCIWDGKMEVFYPRWIYPPIFGSVNAFFLALRLLPTFVSLRSRYDYSLIDSHFGYPEGVAAALLSRRLHCPFTITLRGNEIKHANFPPRKRLMRWAFRRASHIIAVSESLRQFALSLGVSEAVTTCIPNGTDRDVFYRRDYLEARIRLCIEPGKRMILSAGSLTERKGHHRVIRTLRKLREDGIAAELWIAGRRGREDRFEQQIHQAVTDNGLSEAVHFVGYLESSVLAEYMSAADVLCLSSSREGSPNVVHEALSCGLPVVATDVGGVKDLIHNNHNGFVVRSFDDEGFAAAVREALAREWDRSQIAELGQSRSWQKVAAEVLQVMNTVSLRR